MRDDVFIFDGGQTWTKTAQLDQTPDVKYRRAWTMSQFKGKLLCSTLPSGRIHTLRLDGFVALAAGAKPGTVVTKPFKLEGDKLVVNVDAGAGEFSVEVLDEASNPVAGYSVSDAASARRIDELHRQPRWKGDADLSRLKGQTVRLKFTLREAKLYSFQIK